MKVKELKEWLKDKNDEYYVGELTEYGFVDSLSLEYLRAIPTPHTYPLSTKNSNEAFNKPPIEDWRDVPTDIPCR